MGFFSKIGNAVKKVGKAIAGVGKAIWKGVKRFLTGIALALGVSHLHPLLHGAKYSWLLCLRGNDENKESQ